tara:strand:+ start:221 stop:475 length:255 start_codon:yes stop_codon:yes gene_type:complete
MWCIHPGNGLYPGDWKVPGGVQVPDGKNIVIVSQASRFHAYCMDIVGGGSATNDMLIDSACAFITRLAAGSTTPERLSGTINVR